MELTRFSKFSRGVKFMLLQHSFNLLSGIFIGAMVARHYGPELFGAFSLSLFYVSVVAVIAGLGTDDLLAAQCIKEPLSKEGLFWATFFIRLLTFVMCATLGFFVLRFFNVPDLVYKGYGLALLSGLLGNMNLFGAIAKSKQRIDKKAQIAIVSLFLSMAYRVFIVLTNKDIEHLFFNLIMVSFVDLLLMICYLRAEKMMYSFSAPNWSGALQLMRKSLPIAAGSVATIVGGNMALILMSELLGLDSAGRYAVVYKLYGFVIFLSILMHNNLFYYMESSGLSAGKFLEQHLRVIIKTTTAFSYLLIIGSLVALAPLLEILYGEQYQGVGLKFSLVSISFVFAWATIPAQLKLLSEKRTGRIMAIDFIGLAINFSGAYVLIHMYGEWGAYFLIPCAAFSVMLANYFCSGLGNKLKHVFVCFLIPVPTKTALKAFTKH